MSNWTRQRLIPVLSFVLAVALAHLVGCDEGSDPVNLATNRYIEVIEPVADAVFCPTDSISIVWGSTGSGIDSVDVLLLKGNTIEAVVAASIPNTGWFTWLPDNTPSHSESYRFAVRDSRLGIAYLQEGTVRFELDYLAVSRPQDTVCSGDSVNIYWTSACASDSVGIQLVRGEATVCDTIVDITENDGHYTWLVRNYGAMDEEFRFQVTDVESPSIQGHSYRFTIVDSDRLTVTEPLGGESFVDSEWLDITWEYTSCTDDSVRIELYQHGEQVLTIAESTLNNGQFQWQTVSVDPDSTGYTIRVTETDSGGMGECDGPFSIARNCLLSLEQPGGGGSFDQGDEVIVYWNSNQWCGDLLTITVDTPYDSFIVASDEPNDGEYLWLVQQFSGQVGPYTLNLVDPETSTSVSAPETFYIYTSTSTVSVVVTDQLGRPLDAPWHLDGPGGYSHDGSGDEDLYGMNTGDYTITWGTVEFFSLPSPASETFQLDEAETLTIVGQYTWQTGIIEIDIDPGIVASWQLTAPYHGVINGSGCETLGEPGEPPMFAGEYAVVFDAFEHWGIPSVPSDTGTLHGGETLTFETTYTWDESNGIGVFFDPAAGADDNYIDADLFASVNTYLIMTNPTAPTVEAWECSITWNMANAVVVGGYDYEGSAVNALVAPDFAVFLATPLPTSAATLLLSMSLYITDVAGTDFVIDPSSQPSNPENLPMYIDDVNLDNRYLLFNAYGYDPDGTAFPCAGINVPVPASSINGNRTSSFSG